MKQFILALFTFTLLALSACTHLVLDSTERLQVKNLSEETIANLSIVGKNDTLLWVPDTVAPGELSYVHEADFVGTFHVIFYAGESAENMKTVDAGKIEFEGGSELLKISKKDGEWLLKFE